MSVQEGLVIFGGSQKLFKKMSLSLRSEQGGKGTARQKGLGEMSGCLQRSGERAPGGNLGMHHTETAWDLKSDLGIILIGVVKDLPREEWGWEEVRGLGCRVAGKINRGS